MTAKRLASSLMILSFSAIGFEARAEIPEGFYEVASDIGVICYQKDYSGGEPDFVLSVDLTLAEIHSLIGDIADPGTGEGSLGGDNPTIWRQSLQTYWSDSVITWPSSFAVLNGQFFSTNADPTPLAFALKMDGEYISDGYGSTTEYPGLIRMLELNNTASSARVSTFTPEAYYDERTPPDLIAGLDIEADKSSTSYTGRTFFGTADLDGDGLLETVYIFVSSYARQQDAADVLTAFGATAQIMFDGGGSSQLIVQGSTKVESSRTIPHAFVIVAGTDNGGDDAADDGPSCKGKVHIPTLASHSSSGSAGVLVMLGMSGLLLSLLVRRKNRG